MRIASVICEFNPFHKGHKYLIDEIKNKIKPDALVCIMSGNFVQRGEPACTDKYERALSALNNGADLVLAMPCFISLSSAGYFARGGVSIAEGIHSDYLCFGSTSGNIKDINRLASDGIFETADGNDILGAEYIRAAKSKMQPYTVKIDRMLGCASKIRETYSKDFEKTIFNLLQYKLMTTPADILKTAPEVRGGLEYRILENISHSDSLENLKQSIKCKAYTYTGISRMLMQILLGINKSTFSESYAYILGFNEKGLNVIRQSEIKLYANINPALSKVNNDIACDVRADDIYNIIMCRSMYDYSDYVCKPIKINI